MSPNPLGAEQAEEAKTNANDFSGNSISAAAKIAARRWPANSSETGRTSQTR
jgi:hypothetical protein